VLARGEGATFYKKVYTDVLLEWVDFFIYECAVIVALNISMVGDFKAMI